MGGTKQTPMSGYTIDRHADVWDANDFIDKPRCTLFGRPCQQAFSAFFMWEKVLGPLDFKRFVEIGTGYGNTSIFFLLHCLQKEAEFYTFDRMANRLSNSSPLKKLFDLRAKATVGDVYGTTLSQAVLTTINLPGRTVLFLDGGDKPHEFRLFAPALKPGDIVAIHDWGRAVKPEWVQDTIDACGLVPVFAKEHDEHQTLTAMWQRSDYEDSEDHVTR
jgi:predicted O-methyltransferase YrrM